MIYNKISGSVVNPNTAFLFKQFEEEQCFLAFARKTETWGMCALVNITLPTPFVSTLLGLDGKFLDKRCANYTLENSVVRIYKTAKGVSDFDTTAANGVLVNYHSLQTPDIIDTDIYLEYINSTWCVLKNLPSNYRDFMNATNGDKFYIVAMQQANAYPDNPPVGATMVKINQKSVFDYSSLNEPVTMVRSSISQSSGTRIDEPFLPATSITRSTSILGETKFTGLTDAVFEDAGITDTTIQDMNESMNSNGTYFYFVNTKNVRVTEPLYLQPTINMDGAKSLFHYEGDGEGGKYLLLKTQHSYTLPTGVQTKNYYVKVTFDSPATDLAIYHETLPFIYPTVNASNNISDANPPGLDVTYLNNPAVHDSLFDVQGYVRIRKSPNTTNQMNIYSKVSYVKEITSTTEKQNFINMGFSTDANQPRRIESITMTTSEATSRYGNVRPKPNGLPYTERDKRLYLWSCNFIVGDTVTIKIDPDNPDSVLTKTISGINFDEGYITFGSNQDVGVTVIPTEDDLVLSVHSQIVSAPSNIINVIDYAVCDDMKQALFYGMDSVMVTMNIPGTGSDLYEGVYRQLAICHRPKYFDITNNVVADCADSDSDVFTESDTVSLYYDGAASSNHSWEAGTVLYIANKTPVYRKYITSSESFKLII